MEDNGSGAEKERETMTTRKNHEKRGSVTRKRKGRKRKRGSGKRKSEGRKSE